MEVIQRAVMDLTQQVFVPCAYAVQGDSGSRIVEVELRANGLPWEIPAAASLLVRYRKPDGTGGAYDTLPDGTKAWTAEKNVLRVALAPQVCAVPGAVKLALTLVLKSNQLTTFPMDLRVTGPLPEGTHPENYTNLAAWLEKNGNKGASAYELDVKNGFDGTMEEWLAHLHGENGITPNIGANGNWWIGAEDSGHPSCGRDGKTPVRGKDYWTQNDVAELNGYVTAAKEAADAAAQHAGEAASAAAALDKAIDKVAVRDTLTGPLVQGDFIPGTNLDYRIDMEARQEGEGDPSPENVRAFSGVQSASITAGGETVQEDPGGGTTHIIQLPENSYGGYIDGKRGKYVRTHGIKSLTGTEPFSGTSASGIYTFFHDMKKCINYNGTLRCNMLATTESHIATAYTNLSVSGYKDTPNAYPGSNYLYIRTGQETETPETVKAFLSAQYAAGTPVTVVYPLADPVEYDIPGLPALTALDGKTTVYSDAPSVSVTGCMDTKKYIDRKIAELTALALEV